MGKIATIYLMTAPELDNMLNGSEFDVLAVFKLKRFDLFVRSLGRGADKELTANTSYNYLRTLGSFFSGCALWTGFVISNPF